MDWYCGPLETQPAVFETFLEIFACLQRFQWLLQVSAWSVDLSKLLLPFKTTLKILNLDTS